MRTLPRPRRRTIFSLHAKPLPLFTRTLLATGLILVFANLASYVISYNGIPRIGYEGRRSILSSRFANGLRTSAEMKRDLIIYWFNQRLITAIDIGEVLRSLAPLDRLLEASSRGWPESDRIEATAIGQRLAFLTDNVSPFLEIEVADMATGRIILSSSKPPFFRVQDTGWIGNAPSIKPDVSRSWILGLPLKTTGGRAAALLVSVDLNDFFLHLGSDPSDLAFGFKSAILGPDSRVVIGSDNVTFHPGLFPLPLRDLALVGQGNLVPTRTDAGQELYVREVRVSPLGRINLSILVAADRKEADRPILTDIGVTAATGILTTILALLLIGANMRRISLPMRQLVEAIRSFSAGDPEPELPRSAPGEVGLISLSFSALAARVSDWHRELESTLATRTAELELRQAVAWAFAHDSDDDLAYRNAMRITVRSLGAGGGLLYVLDGQGQGRIVRDEGEALSSAGTQALEELRLASRSHNAPFEGLGLTFAHCVARMLGSDGTEIGCILVGRSDRKFQQNELDLFSGVFGALNPLISTRRERNRQEFIRIEAERALRRSEERLRAFFEESLDMIYTTNADDIVASMNGAGMKLLGQTDKFEIIGRPFSNLVQNREDRAYFLERLRAQGFVNDYEVVIKPVGKDPLFCIETARAVRDGQGRTIEIQGIIKDISERIAQEKNLWRTNMELAEANARLKRTQMMIVQHEKLASIGQLAAGIAHEINNPLGFLKSNHGVLAGFLRSIVDAWGEAAAGAPEQLAAIAARFDLPYVFSEIDSLVRDSDEGYLRIMEIVKNLKNFARIDAEVAVGPYDLNKGIESSLMMARNVVKYLAEVELDLGDIPTIEAAGGEINQVILNLIINAAQAIEAQKRPGPGKIAISTRLENGYIVCTVSDDGPGVPEDLRLRIFDPFFTTKEPGKGTGLGLSISYDIIVNKHHGFLTVDRSPLGGGMFRIELPLSSKSPDDGPATGKQA
jgi:PAS domain S-box-containing protein